jgi:hypothetical protein
MTSVSADAVGSLSARSSPARGTRETALDVTLHAVLRVRAEFVHLLAAEPPGLREQLAHDLDALLDRYDHGELDDGGHAAVHLLSCHDLTRAKLLQHLAVLDHEERHPSSP